jgi:hypothetical protein
MSATSPFEVARIKIRAKKPLKKLKERKLGIGKVIAYP